MGEIFLTKSYFLWCMSFVYMFAFGSLYCQLPGLFGNNGILPARLVLKDEGRPLADLMAVKPTLLWYAEYIGLDVHWCLELLCLTGLVLSFLGTIFERCRNAICFLFIWFLYLSLYQVGQTFLSFQWDILLLEAGFLTILVSPLNLFFVKRIFGSSNHHDKLMLWLVRWLVFRLMFASGIVKLTSECPTWWNLTALNYHYESQCIPTSISWYAHQLPEWLQKLTVVGTYFIEIFLPLFFFSPFRLLRIFSFYAQILFQIAIILTGNYNFFNLLTMTLCISIVDDDFFLSWKRIKPPVYRRTSKIYKLVVWAVEFFILLALIYLTVHLFSVRIDSNFTVETNIAFSKKDFLHALNLALPLTIWLGAISLTSEILFVLFKCIYYEKKLLHKVFASLKTIFFSFVALWMFSISMVPHTVIDWGIHTSVWPVIRKWHDRTNTFHLVSSYGLFRRMTGVGGRPEIVIEGSNDFQNWLEYEFLFKPGDTTRSPPFIVPHQPRLDWQMWFAALGNYQNNGWFVNFIYKLLLGQKEVLTLLEKNPFPDSPPKYIKATVYQYHFTSIYKNTTRYSETDWWLRDHPHEYLPILTKDNESLVTYLKEVGFIQVLNRKTIRFKLLARLLRFLRVQVNSLPAPVFLWSLILTNYTISLTRSFLRR